ncbi:Oidioi.mRNA.OKI2018_I69.XSR.g15201.t1.cds [Oikopleura dioica]|uniref:Oidioi.mRNA.OKI2018_I69.XSR.g15201.t1.cds n=1 Tax=Oikopleura dioica TaxID=34765 RepID=A0ABN7SC32_OIKDI|nr:Oidioi.mRNA.OKI2018_I69.XSR.g15201.t1.cds [Oikopleura dioica]
MIVSDEKVIYLPGDNDIGGEGGERVTNRHLERFHRSFSTDFAVLAGRRFQASHEIEREEPRILEKSDVLLRHFPMGSPIPSVGKFGAENIEILMPTCSYRMGVYKMAYGALILGENDEFEFIPLHIPGRFPFLIIYILLCFLWLLYFCIE